MIYPKVGNWLARREGTRKVVAWYRLAQNSKIAPGTLIYSENPVDFTRGRLTTVVRGGTRSTRAMFNEEHPELREVGYIRGGIPSLIALHVVFVCERQVWTLPSGSRPSVVSVSYEGLEQGGLPSFSVMYVHLGNGEPPFPMFGGMTRVRSAPVRSMTNLRLFAGRADPKDATRFSIPFQCDGGRGRFEFQTDIDATDGGKMAPDVWMEWDDSPTTAATTRTAPQ
jgi:hypothetical protein